MKSELDQRQDRKGGGMSLTNPMSFAISKATRIGVKPLVGWYGRSGSGKTMSALLFARGLVGEKGRIVLIDSENGRGSLFADVIPGGYGVIPIDPPFSPERYSEAFTVAEKDADVVVIDSLTHEHNGEGGLLDMQEAELDRMAGADFKKREQCKLAAWIKPKIAHKYFIQKILRCQCALICCLRAEEKTHISKGQDGKSRVITDEFSSPLFDKRFVFELLLSFESIARNGQGGYVIPRKITHPDIAPLLPLENEQIGIKHGEALARWCANPGKVAPPLLPPKQATAATRTWMLTELLKVLDQDAVMEFAIYKGYIEVGQTLDAWPLDKVPMSKGALASLVSEITTWFDQRKAA